MWLKLWKINPGQFPGLALRAHGMVVTIGALLECASKVRACASKVVNKLIPSLLPRSILSLQKRHIWWMIVRRMVFASGSCRGLVGSGNMKPRSTENVSIGHIMV